MSVASKNLYDLLGNDDDGTETPSAPVKTVEKTSTHTAKRNTDGVAPTQAPATGANRRGGFGGGNDGAFRDRNAGSDRNRSRPTDEARGGARGGRDARGRGGRGGRFPRDRDDRQNKGHASGGSEKQAAAGWGATEGEAELKDEQAGEDIAQTEAKDAEAELVAEEPEEPEDKHMTLDAYLAQQAEKRLALEAASIKLRQANEGTKENKQWANAKPLDKVEDADYMAGSGGKSKRERERKVKQVVDIDQTWVEQDRGSSGPRGGRGGPRGGARGDFRGGRGGPRGDFRGGRGGRGGERGEFRGGRGGERGGASRAGGANNAPRGGSNANINTSDEKAFPSLGA